MAKAKLDPVALGYSLAILSGLAMLLLSIVGLFGYAAKAVEIMQAYHLFYSLSAAGITLGIIEAIIFGFVAGYLVVYIYNSFA